MRYQDKGMGRISPHSHELHEPVDCLLFPSTAIETMNTIINARFRANNPGKVQSFLIRRRVDGFEGYEALVGYLRGELEGRESGDITRQLKTRQVKIFILIKELEILFLLH